jgi:hypothetical protein
VQLKVKDPELWGKLHEDDLSCNKKKVMKEEIMEEAVCHGESMANLDSTIDDLMLGGDTALKTKLLKDKEKLEKFKENIKNAVINGCAFVVNGTPNSEFRSHVKQYNYAKKLNGAEVNMRSEIFYQIVMGEWQIFLIEKMAESLLKQEPMYWSISLRIILARHW